MEKLAVCRFIPVQKLDQFFLKKNLFKKKRQKSKMDKIKSYKKDK